jgi:hypothetical protein
MKTISPEEFGVARPLDDILQECEEIAAHDFHRIREDTRDVWLEAAELSKKKWHSMFAFRGQSRLHQIKVRSSKGVGDWISLHSSGYRFVHDLDWTLRWWPDASGTTFPEALALHDRIDTQVRGFQENRLRWYYHLARHPLTKELVNQVTDAGMQVFRKNARLQELFPRPLVTPEENRELQRGLAESMHWTNAFVGSLGQHYGIRSEYLDLTYSPKVAARFALEDNWQRVLAGERVYGFIMSFNIPFVVMEIQKFKQKWASAYPTIVDISWIPATIANRPGLQQGLSLSNSPSPLYGPYIVESGWSSCTAFYTLPCREMEEIAQLDLMPGNDPFHEVLQAFRAADYDPDIAILRECGAFESKF